MKIRRARSEDAEAAALIIRKSIAELCVRDHGGSTEVIAHWNANKTADNVRTWMNAGTMVVAEEGEALLGVAAMTPGGLVTLNYVAPDARFRGVSKALLSALEGHARTEGLAVLRLQSTETAHRFYLASGFRDAGSTLPGPSQGSLHSMVKQIG